MDLSFCGIPYIWEMEKYCEYYHKFCDLITKKNYKDYKTDDSDDKPAKKKKLQDLIENKKSNATEKQSV
jgi:hypothetical protein